MDPKDAWSQTRGNRVMLRAWMARDFGYDRMICPNVQGLWKVRDTQTRHKGKTFQERKLLQNQTTIMGSPDSRSMKNLEGKFTDPEELNSQNIHDTPKENTGGNQGGSNGRVTVSFKSTQKRDLKLMGKTKYKNGKAVDSGFYSHARGKGGK